MCFLKECQDTGKQLKVNNCLFWPLGQQGYCFIENENLKLWSQGSGERKAMRFFMLHSGKQQKHETQTITMARVSTGCFPFLASYPKN